MFDEGFSGLGTHIFTLDTPPPGMEGGLRNAILGSLMITLFGLLIGTPIGILCGIFLAEFGQRSELAAATRFMNDILLSRALYRNRPVYLRIGGGAARPFFRLGRLAGAYRCW